ncbi:MAG: type II secretion system F family protein [Candidatus Undinarchaeales archaeon]|jgi:archaellum biogenesis protein FlaJ (TadC family)|nr:type II secretion system F family protein [Candidatus Undinarchaeales archaeon]
MEIKKEYSQLSARLFNSLVDKHLEKFTWVKQDLKKAGIKMMLREYLSVCLLSTALALPAWLLILTFFFIILGVPAPIISAVFASILLTAGTFVVAIEFPATKAKERERNIDNNLPFACLYMNTIAGTGAPPYMIFKFLSEFKEYGEVSVEAGKINEEIEVMGEDIEKALRRAARDTPSENFKDLLWGMITAIVQGGNLKALLETKASQLMNSYRRKLDDFTADVSMYVEIYITVIIVGSIFTIVMMTIMGAISGFGTLKNTQTLVVYVLLPVASIVFIVLLRVMSPLSK